MRTKTGILTATLTTAFVLVGAQAYAHTVAFFARLGFFTFQGQAFVPLTRAGATQVTFTGSGRKTITYTAQCAQGSLGTFTGLFVSIVVDGDPLAPVGVLCSANDVMCLDSMVTSCPLRRGVR